MTSDLGYQNWDMRASHHVCAQAFASVLNQSARLSDRDPLIPCDVTHKTREMVKKGATKRLADELGVPVGLLKACRLAMLYGGKTGFGSAIYKACEEHVMSQGVSNIFGESRLLAKRVEQAHESLTELADSLISITRRLVEEPWFLVKKINRLRRCLRTRKTSEGIEVVNAVGGALLALDKSGKWLVKAESVFSHIITGIEQDFINNLIKASAGSNFHVLSYEHDGLLTTGQMPPNALKNAQKASLLANYAEIDIKPFIKPGGDPFLRALAKRSASPAEDESMVEVPMPGCLADYFEFHRGHEK